MDQINERIRSLDKRLDTSYYSQQKCHVKTELGEFLATLDPPKDFFTALRKYLVFKERKGRTQMHAGNCYFRGQTGKKSCECPITLAAKSVDSSIGKLRAIFRDMGRSGEWNPVLLTGNPAASHVMKRHLQSVTLEQSCHEVVRKQAVPTLFFYARISRKDSKRANGTQNKPVSMRCNYSDILSFAITGDFSQPSKGASGNLPKVCGLAYT